VLFRGNGARLGFDLEDGMQVQLFGEPSLYEARGQLQLIVKKVEQQGQGDLQKQFERLKEKLSAEGLFDSANKKEIPAFPQTVGIITSATSAALQDMLNVLGRRAPWVQPVLYPVQVQGKGAEVGIANAISHWSQDQKLPSVDVLIIGRGGGSIEDLWNFNEEVVARAIAACPIPVISAVGHEIDFTIADFVADLRAPTPSAAVELAVPDGDELKRQLSVYRNVLDKMVSQRIERSQLLLDNMKQVVKSKSPDAFLRECTMRLDSLSQEMDTIIQQKYVDQKNRLRVLREKLLAKQPEHKVNAMRDKVVSLRDTLNRVAEDKLKHAAQKLENLQQLHHALGPQTAFSRGFSVATNTNGEIVRSKKELLPGDTLQTKFSDGTVESVVTK